MRSGLHGLGHWIERAEYDGDAELRERLVMYIDDFVARYQLPWYSRLRKSLYCFVWRRSDPSLELVKYA